ncbi:helix-turn-helix domain-containing protein [Macrococcoides goetzii]|uniref:helix-turn-helix domain-containing protein n=1 Tax=Macrococcus sp. PK TaxID=2801919 RepID=UPI001F0D0086|nr:helix-turn-helix transcriptional regulator [Macrococcus sp. PK]MCH4984907.1 helix-turn-helix transcriptional regulator [Macrococcus sp. PK]
MTFGERLKELRVKKGWTQEQLGEKIGVQKAAINKYEKGLIKNPKDKTINKLAKLFNVSPSYIRGYEDEKLNVGYLYFDILLKKYSENTQEGKALRYFNKDQREKMLISQIDNILKSQHIQKEYQDLKSMADKLELAEMVNDYFSDIYMNEVKTNNNLTDLVLSELYGIEELANNYNIYKTKRNFENNDLDIIGSVKEIELGIDSSLQEKILLLTSQIISEIEKLKKDLADNPSRKGLSIVIKDKYYQTINYKIINEIKTDEEINMEIEDMINTIKNKGD